MNINDINIDFIWPTAAELKEYQTGNALYKHDSLLTGAEFLITEGKAWAPISGSTKRVEPVEKLSTWLDEQMVKKAICDRATGVTYNVSLTIDQFPDTADVSVKKVIATSKNIAYLIDHCDDFLKILQTGFGLETCQKAKSILDPALGVFLYVTNSVESGGRAFSGDPFTGQAAAYSRIFAFDLLGNRVLNFVAYYPHQLYSQLYGRGCEIPKNKGVRMLRSQATLIITAGGVMVEPKSWRII